MESQWDQCTCSTVPSIQLGPMALILSRYMAVHSIYSIRRTISYFTRGLYKAIDIRTQCPEGISAEHIDHIVGGFPMLKTKRYPLTGRRQFWPALAEALTCGSHLSKSLKNTLSNLYCKGALRVEPLGLQCLKFDIDVYTILKNRFSVFQSAMKSVGKREANFPAASMPSSLPKSKRKKIH